MGASGMRGALFKMALLFATLAVCLGAAEVVLRSLPETRLGFHYYGKQERFGPPREFVLNTSPNSIGFHDVEHGPKAPGVERILLLGDSYVESYSMHASRNVGQRLQHHLDAARGEGAGPRFEVVSIGRSGWGQREQLEALREFGQAISPDLVLTLFLTLNDVQNNSDVLRERTKLQQLDPELMFRPNASRRPAESMPFFWFEHSRLNQLISHRLAWGLFRSNADDVRSIPVDYYVYATAPDPTWENAWQETEGLLLGTRAVASELGARYAVASASTPQGVLGAERGLELLLQSYPAMRGFEWDLELPDRRLAGICASHGIPFVALMPRFRKETAAGRELHWPYDSHWTEAGNDLAGEVMADFVRSLESQSPDGGPRREVASPRQSRLIGERPDST